MVEQGLGGRAAAIAEGLVDAGKPAEARSFLDRPTDKVPDSLRKAEVLADADSTMLASLDDQHARVEWMTAIAERMADDGLPDDALAVLTEAVAVSDRGDIAGVAEAAARIGGDAAVLHLIQRSWGLGLISRSGGCTLAIDGSAC